MSVIFVRLDHTDRVYSLRDYVKFSYICCEQVTGCCAVAARQFGSVYAHGWISISVAGKQGSIDSRLFTQSHCKHRYLPL